jgi:hypothetical protein
MKNNHDKGERDQDRMKGAIEDVFPAGRGNPGLQSQLGHRDQDPLIKGADTDFPEPGQNPEHSGEPDKSRKRRRTSRSKARKNSF